MSLGRYKTAGETLQQVGRELGLGTTVDPFASSNAVWLRLVSALVRAGRRLAASYEWPQLIGEALLVKSGGVWTLPTGWSVSSGDVLNLPADWDHMISRTHWDRTNQTPAGGPLNPQTWQYRQASVLQTIWAEYREATNTLSFLPTPLGDRTLAMEYASTAWVRPAASGLGNGNTLGAAGWDTPEASGDFVLFAPEVINAATTLEYKKMTGQFTGQAQRDFDELVSTYVAKTPRPVLSLDGKDQRPHFLVPETGFGS